MTDTMTHTNLRMVTVSPDYRDWPSTMPNEAKGETFFAYDGDDFPGYVRLLLPRERGLAVGFYASTSDGPDNVGWNVHTRHLTAVPSPDASENGTEEPASTEAAGESTPVPFTPVRGDRVRVTALPATPARYGVPDSLLGEAATYIERDTYDVERAILVENGEGRRYWVKSVGPFIPTTEAELAAILAAATDAAKREGMREGRAAANEEFETWKSHANEVAIEYANNNSLCSEFDRCMVAIGLNPRDSYEREAIVNLSFSVSVTISGNGDEDEAIERALELIREGYTDADDTDVDWE